MFIRYTGTSGRRIVEDIAWTRQERVQPVEDPVLVANLITHVGFEIDADDPVLQIVGEERVGALAIEAQIVTVDALSRLSKKQIKAVADSLGVTPADVEAWVTSASALYNAMLADEQPSSEEITNAQSGEESPGDKSMPAADALTDDGGE